MSGGGSGWTAPSSGSSNAATPWAYPSPPTRASEQRSRGGSSSSGTASPRSGGSSSSGSGGSTASRSSGGSSDRSASSGSNESGSPRRAVPASNRPRGDRPAVGEAVERTGPSGGGGGGGGGYPSYPYYPYYPYYPVPLGAGFGFGLGYLYYDPFYSGYTAMATTTSLGSEAVAVAAAVTPSVTSHGTKKTVRCG